MTRPKVSAGHGSHELLDNELYCRKEFFCAAGLFIVSNCGDFFFFFLDELKVYVVISMLAKEFFLTDSC